MTFRLRKFGMTITRRVLAKALLRPLTKALMKLLAKAVGPQPPWTSAWRSSRRRSSTGSGWCGP